MKFYLTVSSVLNLIAAVGLTLVVLVAAGKSNVRRSFLLFLTSISGWTFGYALWQLSSTEANALLFCQVLMGFAMFIPVTFFNFTLTLSERKSPVELLTGYLACALIVATIPFGTIVSGVSARPSLDYWPDAGPLMGLAIVVFTYFVVRSAYTLFQGARSHLGARASEIKFVLGSSFIGYIGGGTNFPFWYDVPIPPYGNMIVFVYLLLTAYGVYSNTIPNINVDLYRAFVGLLLNASVALFYVIVLTLFNALTDSSMSVRDYWLHGSSAFLVSVFVFWGVPRLKVWTETVFDGVFRREWSSALTRLKSLPAKISDLADEESIAELVTENIRSSLDVSYAAFFSLRDFESDYHCVHFKGQPPEGLEKYGVNASNPLIEMLSASPECIVLDRIYGEIEGAAYRALVELRNDLDVSIVVPIFANHDLYGMILLGPNEAGSRSTSEEEVSILYSIGAQIGINKRTRDFERRTNEMDKLVALGTMAAGLSHEIRNPLVSVQTLASLMKGGRSIDAVPDDFRSVLLRDIKRIGSIVEGVALYSHSQEARKVPVRIHEIVESSVDIHKDEAERGGVTLQYDSDGVEDVLVSGNFDQLGQVLNNLIENAIHAVAGVDAPVVQVMAQRRRLGRPDGQSWVEVTVTDNGSGVPETIIERIFDPFITSKDTGTREAQKGMGLGLAISKRIIDSHGGAISASNTKDGGAKFVVSLRCLGLDSQDA